MIIKAKVAATATAVVAVAVVVIRVEQWEHTSKYTYHNVCYV